MESDRG